jgi:hypothetical protein
MISPHLKRLLLVLLGALSITPAFAQMVSGEKVKNYTDVFGVQIDQRFYPYDVTLIDSKPAGNILQPGEQPVLTLLFTNNGTEPIQNASAKIDVMQFGSKGIPGDIWLPQLFKIADLPSLPIQVDIPAKGSQVVEIRPNLPDTFGAYGFVADLGPSGRRFAASCVRTFAPTPEKIQYPKFALDLTTGIDVLRGLGVEAVRMGIPYTQTTGKDYAGEMAKLDAEMRDCAARNITVTLMFGGGDAPQPLGQPRPHLTDDAVMMKTKTDIAWMPESDPDFQKYVTTICSKYGWPKGPITAVTLWNEPWEGASISGWQSDSIRFREIFTAMAHGVEQARTTGVDVLIGGTDSSSNTLDKLFGDGKNTFLKWLDVCSIHYQGIDPPSLIKAWINRKGPRGRVKIWDTESWVANTDDRVAVVVAANRAAGYDRGMGVFYGNVSSENKKRVKMPDGTLNEIDTFNAWGPAVAIGAMQHCIGERNFNRLLFLKGLPWIFVFDGLKDNPDDGTAVVVGDLTEEYTTLLPFRTVFSSSDMKAKDAIREQLKTLPADSPDRASLETSLQTKGILTDGSLTVQNPAHEFVLYDFYGNVVPATGDTIQVPLDYRGFYLRTNGTAGSFARLTQALTAARIDGYEPVEIIAHDIQAPIEQKPSLHLSLTNILNRPISGTLTLSLGDLSLAVPAKIDLAPHETKELMVPISGGASRPDNTYPLTARLDAGADGVAEHYENLHVNFIAKRTIAIDGSLDDWKGVLPQSVTATGSEGPTMMEKAWLPFEKFDTTQKGGFATGYLAYDDKNFYFAAKIADNTPTPGTIRYATRNDDDYFYPELSYQYDPIKTLLKKDYTWTDEQKLGRSTGALFLPNSTTDRSFTAWTGVAEAFAVDFKLPADSYKQVSFYLLDWDNTGLGRARTRIEVQDAATGKILAKSDVADYGPGVYAKFLLSGNVRVIFRGSNWLGAAVNGIFFDPSTAPDQPAGTASAKFLGLDLQTMAKWQGTYGSDGYQIIGTDSKFPSYAQVTVPVVDEKKTFTWPAGVRRYSYRKSPDLPFGAAPKFDNVQIAFNVIPADQKAAMIPNSPGTMPGFVPMEDTDYEYALNQVAPQFGGGTEVWRSLVPGMPDKDFYPRQPASPFDGPVKNAKLVVRWDGNTRIVECAIPWSEMPLVKKACDAGQTIKFTYRINDNTGDPMELAENRSVSQQNPHTFHPAWVHHWSNQLEFSFEK